MSRETGSIALLYPGRANGRRFALVSKVLSSMGLKHVAVVPLLQRHKLGRLEKDALASPNCEQVRKLPAGTDFLIGTADQLAKLPTSAGQKRLTLSFDTANYLAKPNVPEAFFHPILFHPDLISEAHYAEAAQLSSGKDRSIGVLFAGNCDPATYDTSTTGGSGNILNRVEIEKLVRALPEPVRYFPGSREEFEQALAAGDLTNKLVWIDTDRFRIPQGDWLKFITQSRFFIATPGVRYPYCQNLNEAAACGSVPLLQFPQCYSPVLDDGRSCLTFFGTDDFEKCVENALTMKEGAWANLSKGAIEYHDDHLSLAALQKRLADFFYSPEQNTLTWVMAGK